MATAKLNLLNPIVVPTPEAVFHAIVLQRKFLLQGIFSSLQLLIIGFAVAIPLSVASGIIVGWVPRLKNCIYPIARVIAPIPPSIYTPYIIALMPTFRSASAMVLILGLFWPSFLNIILKVGNIETGIRDNIRALCLSKRSAFLNVLLPYLLPGVVTGLHVQLSTSFLLLTLAEMMGASGGMGYFVRNNADYARYTNVVAGIIVVGIMITVLNCCITIGENKISRKK